MSALRRIISFIALLAFLPASIAAGALSVCIAQDGHSQVESVFNVLEHHQHDASSVRAKHANPNDLSILLYDGLACQDRPIVVCGRITASGAVSPDFLLSLINAEVVAGYLKVGTIRVVPRSPRGDPRLVAHATIVLNL